MNQWVTHPMIGRSTLQWSGMDENWAHCSLSSKRGIPAEDARSLGAVSLAAKKDKCVWIAERLPFMPVAQSSEHCPGTGLPSLDWLRVTALPMRVLRGAHKHRDESAALDERSWVFSRFVVLSPGQVVLRMGQAPACVC